VPAPLSEAAGSKLQKTLEHYNHYPYEVNVVGSPAYRAAHNPVGRFIQKVRGGSVLDIGCGPGNLLPAIAGRAGRTVGLDMSPTSLRHAARVVQGLAVELVRGNALDLPFPDASFDHVVASGSLHHTPDARAGFLEACRVLRPGGLGFLSVYRKPSHYFFLYHTLGALTRLCERFAPSRFLVNRCLVLPLFTLYFLGGRWLVHRKLALPSRRQVMNYFGDQLLTPVATFHTLAEVSQWAQAAGVEITAHGCSHLGSLLNVEFRKKDPASGGLP
jgi:SAM-dependent methyltransferase